MLVKMVWRFVVVLKEPMEIWRLAKRQERMSSSDVETSPARVN